MKYKGELAKIPKTKFIVKVLIVVFVLGVIYILFGKNAESSEFSNEAIVNAIYKAEGGVKAQYPFGIRSLRYEDRNNKALSRYEWAKMICHNTVVNNRRKYKEWDIDRFDTYLEFLASRYCPINAKNDKKSLNVNWLNNVKWFLCNNS